MIPRIQAGIVDLMESAKDKLKATRLEKILDARSNQAVYASTLGKPWDAFISHASEDKQAFVEPLANALGASGLNVWYDKTSLTIGDRLRQKIDEGLAQSRYGVVVLSHSFFAKQWPKDELEGLFAREISGAPGIKVILPVWHSITASDVARYSPMLAGRLAADSKDGLVVVVRQLREAMGLQLERQTDQPYEYSANSGSVLESARAEAAAPQTSTVNGKSSHLGSKSFQITSGLVGNAIAKTIKPSMKPGISQTARTDKLRHCLVTQEGFLRSPRRSTKCYPKTLCSKPIQRGNG